MLLAVLLAVLFYFIWEGFALPTPALDTSGLSQAAPNISSSTSTRTVPGIIWSCLTTIFACTWVAVHPNIPSRHDSDQDLLWRRVKILAVALIAPEYIILWAANQLWSAKRAVNQLHNYPGCSDWTLTHGMFLVMGGFMLTKDSGEVIGVLQASELVTLLKENSVLLPSISSSEIMDRSKGDVVSKTLVLVQTTWFMAQVISRAFQHLAVTELEITTVAFASLNILTYILWWTKPLDVRHPILLSMRPRQVVSEAPELSDSETGALRETSDIPFNNQFQSPLQAVAGFSTDFFEASFFSDTFVSTRFALSHISLPLVEPGVPPDGGIEKDTRTDGGNIRQGRKKKDKDMRSTRNPFYLPHRLGDNSVALDATLPSFTFEKFPPHYDFCNSTAVPEDADITDAGTSQLPLASLAQVADRNALKMYHCKPSGASLESICAEGISPVVDRKENLPRPEITVVNSDLDTPHRRLPLSLLEHGKWYINRVWRGFHLSLLGFVSPWWRKSNVTSDYMSTQSLPDITTRTSLASMSFPTLELTTRVPTLYGGPPRPADGKGSLYPTSLEMLLGVIFGAIHCVAWNFQFPTNLERVLWQTTSLCMTLAPLVFMTYLMLFHVLYPTHWTPGIESAWRMFILAKIVLPIYVWTRWVIFITYIVARLATFVLAFTLLRDLPLAALQEVQWTTFIPHV